MKAKINFLCSAGLVVVSTAFIVFVLYRRFTNIDMTETRFFVTYWMEYAISFALIVIFSVVRELTRKKETK